MSKNFIVIGLLVLFFGFPLYGWTLKATIEVEEYNRVVKVIHFDDITHITSINNIIYVAKDNDNLFSVTFVNKDHEVLNLIISQKMFIQASNLININKKNINTFYLNSNGLLIHLHSETR